MAICRLCCSSFDSSISSYLALARSVLSSCEPACEGGPEGPQPQLAIGWIGMDRDGLLLHQYSLPPTAVQFGKFCTWPTTLTPTHPTCPHREPKARDHG
ncbi:hypothetical protein Mapa_008774 [Marchantia paleacea]|nr:hypothetical protein Mapa_008774 [Marchantia paleacea]